jgi:4-diphosphocytidyl-2-C-methyl-D-erythritol kinase
MICFPNAKVNIGLSVKDKRSDNYHNIESCIIPIPLYDIIEIRKSSIYSLSLYGTDVDCVVEENLINRTWELLSKKFKNLRPVDVCLYKNIPVGSGLGGGSSDSAFFLKLINGFNSLGLTISEMETIAGKIGSDCPFFIRNSAAIVTGKGNLISHINNPIVGKYLTIVFSGRKVSTKEAFENVTPKYNPTGIVDLLKLGIHNWRDKIWNDFEDELLKTDSDLNHIRSFLYNSGAAYVSLTGTGSAIYAISDKPLDCMGLIGWFELWQVKID